MIILMWCLIAYLVIGIILLLISVADRGDFDLADGWFPSWIICPIIVVFWFPMMMFGLYRPF